VNLGTSDGGIRMRTNKGSLSVSSTVITNCDLYGYGDTSLIEMSNVNSSNTGGGSLIAIESNSGVVSVGGRHLAPVRGLLCSLPWGGEEQGWAALTVLRFFHVLQIANVNVDVLSIKTTGGTLSLADVNAEQVLVGVVCPAFLPFGPPSPSLPSLHMGPCSLLPAFSLTMSAGLQHWACGGIWLDSTQAWGFSS
jgi:hypothetical protein